VSEAWHDSLPAGWAIGTIGDLVGSEGEFTDGDWVESKDQDPEGDVRLVQLADVGDGTYLNRSSRFLTSRKAAELRCTFIHQGDVLVARMPEPLGRACLFPGDSKPSVTVVDVCIVRPAAPIDRRWLVSSINAPQFRGAVASLQSGSTRKRISRGNLATLRLAIPPAPEQRRIADSIEQGLTRIGVGIADLERVKSQLARYRASVLKAACEGRLVPTEAELARAEGREYETAEEMLERVIGKRLSVREAEDVPEGWCLSTLDRLAVKITSGSRDWSPYYGRGSAVFVLAQNVRPGRIDLTVKQPVDPPHDDPSRARSQIAPGDILITIVGANTGDVCRVPNDLPEHYVCQSVALVRPIEPALSDFITLYLVSEDHGQRQFEGFMYGQGRPHLSFEQLKSTAVAIPPLAEQRRIVAEVERRLSIADGIAGTIDTALVRAERLRQSILKRAFEGGLVPQDPNDEPASVLLDRIRKEREAAAETGNRASRPRTARRPRGVRRRSKGDSG
jgi:type I restriction enzyme S subunit